MSDQPTNKQLPTLPSLQDWQKRHEVMAFIATDSSHLNFSVQKGDHVLLIAGPAEIFGRTSAYDITFGDLMEHMARDVFVAKPEGSAYLEFVSHFGQDCTDDLMSIVRALDMFDDSISG